jgi:acylphosphatase
MRNPFLLISKLPAPFLLGLTFLLAACSRYSSPAPTHAHAEPTPLSQPGTNSAMHAVKTERRTVCFSGNVQGVGFRNTTVQLSSGLELAGTVRNLDDGRVELVVEGTPSEIDKLVARLRERFGTNIRNVEQSSSTPQGMVSGVRVIY